MSEDGPWLDMSVYPNLAPDDAVPEQVLGLLRDVLRAQQVAPLHPDVWQDVLHGAGDGEVHRGITGRPGTPCPARRRRS